MNENLVIRSHPVYFEAAQDKVGASRFKMTAYTGGELNAGGFDEPCVVDYRGLILPRQQIPVYFNHDPDKAVGHTDRIDLIGNDLIAEGIISRDTAYASDVKKSGLLGFPWQASIAGYIQDSEYVASCQAIEVNGKEFVGPVNIIRKLELYEISFVEYGADSHTSAKVYAKQKDNLMSQEQMIEKQQQAEEEIKTLEASDKKTQCDGDKEQMPETDRPQMTCGPEGCHVVYPTVKAQASVDEEVSKLRDKMAVEKERIQAISDIGEGKNPALEARGIREGWSPEKFELEFLRASRAQTPEPKGEDGIRTDIRRGLLEAIAANASGKSMSYIEAQFKGREHVLDAMDKYRGIGLKEFVEIACGRSLPNFKRSPDAWLQAAFSTNTVSEILSNVANKQLLDGFNYVETAWREICNIASVNDFKTHSRYRLTGNFNYEEVPASGEITHGGLSENVFTQKARTYATGFTITRQMIIDDDLSAFACIPQQIGIGAAEKINEIVWTKILSNPTQKDGKAFFSSDHDSLITGATTNLSLSSLEEASETFALKTKPNGQPLGIMPTILLVPPKLYNTAQALMIAPTILQETSTAVPNINTMRGRYKVVSSAYLSNSSYEGYSDKAWYLFADPVRLPAIEVAFLNGRDRPTIEQAEADMNQLGICFRGFIDFGVTEQDWHGALKVKGEA